MGTIGHALGVAGSMTWEILWALIRGFALSARGGRTERQLLVTGGYWAWPRPAPGGPVGFAPVRSVSEASLGDGRFVAR
jgi:hypothetical protein